MSSVFTGSFKNTIERIDSLTDTSSRRPQNVEAEKFANILGDFEAETKNSPMLTEKHTSQPPLSNLAPIEKEQINAKSSEPVFNLESSLLHTTSYSKYPETPVKNPTLSVNPNTEKTISGEGILQVENTIPAKPNLLTAKRVEVYKAQQNAKYELSDIKEFITSAGFTNGIDPLLGLAVAKAESSFNPNAISSDGYNSKGLFQLLDSTAADMMTRMGTEGLAYKPFDPGMNSHLGLGYLRRLHDIFSVETQLTKNIKTHPVTSSSELEKLAVAAFNAGELNVAKAQERAQREGLDPSRFSSIEKYLPEITRIYVARVQDNKKLLEADSFSLQG